MADVPMRAGVGDGGANKPADVAIVQDLINRQPTTMVLLPLDGLATPELAAAIRTYQADELKSASPDGRVDAGGFTLIQLLHKATPTAAFQLFGTRRATLGPATRVATVTDLYKRQFLTAPPGLGTLVTAMIADVDLTDIRWAAYMLATVRIETADTFQPIEEYGKGAGRAYGTAEPYADAGGKKYANVYYGRGYVQLTWLRNYLGVGQAIGLDDQLAVDPAKALDPQIAYRIMSYGMRNGTFTGRSLSGYIAGTQCDYPHARRIINGMDRAFEIAAAAEALEIILRVAAI